MSVAGCCCTVYAADDQQQRAAAQQVSTGAENMHSSSTKAGESGVRGVGCVLPLRMSQYYRGSLQYKRSSTCVVAGEQQQA
jgi:hypothetical protein